MELIGDSDDHRFDLWIGQHLLVLAIGHLGFPNLRHPNSQVVGGITNSVESGIPRSLAALEMGGLGDHPTAKDTNANRVRGLSHAFSIIVKKMSNNATRSRSPSTCPDFPPLVHRLLARQGW